jgi:hypothetical protein
MWGPVVAGSDLPDADDHIGATVAPGRPWGPVGPWSPRNPVGRDLVLKSEASSEPFFTLAEVKALLAMSGVGAKGPPSRARTYPA